MAYLRKRPGSRYWHLRFRNLETGGWAEVSLKLLHSDPSDTRKAMKRCDEASKKEAMIAPDQSGEWSAWVPAYIESHYSRVNTRKRSEFAWARINEFCKLKNIRHPAAVRWEHGQKYLMWRKGLDPQAKIGIKATHNTARLEVKFWSFLLQEAVRRGYCEGNVLSAFKIEKAPSRVKGDIDSLGLMKAREAFKKKPKWMRTIFEICAHIGCRFNEASMPMSQIDFVNHMITVCDSKRDMNDPKKFYKVPMPESLEAYLQTLKGAERTAPPIVGDMNRAFNKVMKEACGETSHSLRVAFITRCHRAGLTEKQCMLLVNHSTAMVHAIYTRMDDQDARKAMSQVPPPPIDGL